MRFGTWNIKSLNGKEVEIVREMEKYRLELLGLSEVKKKGSGEKRLEKGFILRYCLCVLVVSVEDYKHRGPGFDSRALLGIFLRELGLDQGPLSLVIG
jgi:hypothetical protein